MLDPVQVPLDDLRALFDIAVNSMDFGSGFLGDEEVRTLRTIAVAIGVNPMKATPYEYRKRMEHEFEPYNHPTPAYVQEQGRLMGVTDEHRAAVRAVVCNWCSQGPDDNIHKIEGI